MTLGEPHDLGAHAGEDGVTIRTFKPLASSVVMPLRLVQGTAGPVEGAASLGLGLLALVLITAWAGRVYRRAVLRTGTRLRWGQVLTGRS